MASIINSLYWNTGYFGSNKLVTSYLHVTGGEGGIRTLGDVATTPDFESGTFDHSATSPAFTIAAGLGRKFYQLRLSTQFCHAAHIRTQHFRHRHRAVGVLIILQHGHQGTAHGQA